MPINPMTGDMYDISAPIGTTALNQRPDQFKALDWFNGKNGTLFQAMGYRSRRSLLVNGPYKSTAMRKASMRDFYDKSFESSSGNASWMNMARDEGRDLIGKANPFTWFRAPSMGAFDPMINRTEGTAVSKLLKYSRLDRLGIVKNNLLDEDGNLNHYWDPKLFSRLGAASTWDRRALKAGSDKILDSTQQATMRSYLEKANPELLSRLSEGDTFANLTLKDAGSITRMSMKNSITGQFGGMIEGVLNPKGAMDALMRDSAGNLTNAGIGYERGQAFHQLNEIYRNEGVTGVRDLAGKSEADLAKKGLGSLARKGAESFAEKGIATLALRAGLEAGGTALAQFIPGVDVAVDVYMAYQLAKQGSKMAEAAIKGGIRTVAGAFKSYEGSIQHPMFGMGYHDTLAAATSRSRGVQAIQNSRLNARSALGTEAAGIYQHFS